MGATDLEHDWLDRQRALARELPSLLEATRRAAASDPTPLGDWRERIVAALRSVGAALEAHAESDEHPEGFLPTSERRAPRLIHALEELRTEHRTLVGDVTDAELAAKHTHTVGAVPSTVGTVEEVLAAIDRHLATAYRLALDIANDDLGQGD